MENDIRVERTKAALRDAFVTLLEDTSVYSISVTNLTKKAMVSRVTFYIHYTDMADFIKKTCDSLLSDIVWTHSKDKNIFLIENAEQAIRKQAETIRDNVSIFRALLGPNGPEAFHESLIELVSREYLSHIYKDREEFIDETDMVALIKYVSAGEIQLVTDYIKNDPIDSIDKLVDRVVTFTFKGVFKSFGLMED